MCVGGDGEGGGANSYNFSSAKNGESMKHNRTKTYFFEMEYRRIFSQMSLELYLQRWVHN